MARFWLMHLHETLKIISWLTVILEKWERQGSPFWILILFFPLWNEIISTLLG